MPPRFLPFAVLALSSPAICQVEEAALQPSDPSNFSDFGGAVDIRGEVAIVGASDKAISGFNYAGAAYVYRRVGGVWGQEARLTVPAPEIHDNFGTSVAIHGDLALVGAPDFAYSSFTGTGRVHVFKRIAGAWTLVSEITASDAGVDDSFGRRIAFDGQTLLVQANRDFVYRVYSFDYDGSGFTETQKLVADQPFTLFGDALAIDGDSALVGARWEWLGEIEQAGAVHALRRVGGAWSEEALVLDPQPDSGSEFGASLDLDGDLALIGTPSDNVSSVPGAGTAFLYRRQPNGAWNFEQELAPCAPGALAGFGSSVELEGDLAVVAAPSQDLLASNVGAVAVYRRDGTSWVAEAPFLPADAFPGDSFGRTLDLDGERAVIGSWHETPGFIGSGSAYVFDLTAPPGAFVLQYSPLPAQAGEDLTLDVRSGLPTSATWLILGFAGLESLSLPSIGITLGVASPVLLDFGSTDAQGASEWQYVLPSNIVGASLWLQAIQVGASSNVSMMTIVAP